MYEKRGRRRSADEGVGRELVANLPALCEFKARSRLTHAHSDGALPVAHEARRPWGGGALPPIAPWMAAGAGTEVSDDTSHAVHAPRAEGGGRRAEGGASPTNAVQVSPQGRRDEGRRGGVAARRAELDGRSLVAVRGMQWEQPTHYGRRARGGREALAGNQAAQMPLQVYWYY